MKANTAETYVIKRDNKNAPDWFHDEAAAGRIRLFYDEDEFTHLTVFTPVKTVRGNVGDVLVKTRNGISVLTKEQAKKYNVTGR